MKRKIFLLITILSISAFSQLVSIPQIILDTAKGGKTTITGIPTVLKDVDVSINGYSIISYSISNDSVVLVASPRLPIDPIDPIDPIFDVEATSSAPIGIITNGKLIRFSVAGVYKFFMVETFIAEPVNNSSNGVIIPPRFMRSLGSARILPLIKTTPGMAIAGDSIILQLILGERIDCDDRYISSYTIRDSILTLAYTIRPSMPICILPVVPKPYGPVFRIAPQTKDLNVSIGDSLNLGVLKVYEPKIIQGTVTDAISDAHVPGATKIIAFRDNSCGGLIWGGNQVESDTTETLCDRSGNYTLKIPNDGSDYRIEALPSEREYKMQAAYTSMFPVTRSIPPSSTIDFALIPIDGKDTVNLVIKVTKGGRPISGAYVSLNPGREPLFCIQPYELALKPIAIQPDTTNSEGILVVKNIALVPFTWHAWNCYVTNPTVIKKGNVLLNSVKNDTLVIEFDPTSSERVVSRATPTLLSVNPNPFRPTTRITFNNSVENAKISIINAHGQKVFGLNNFKGSQLFWNAKGLAAGIYMVRAEIGNQVLMTKAILRK